MRMLAVARKADHRLRLEIHLKAVLTEDLAHHRAHNQFIVRRLQGVRKAPVDLDLLAHMRHLARLVNLRLETTDLLVPHLNLQSVAIEQHDRLLQRRAHSAVRTLPILLLHDLRSRKFLHIRLFERRLDPELQLGSRSELEIDNLRAVDMLKARNVRMLLEHLQEFLFQVDQGILQDGTRIDALAVMDEKGRDAQRADGLARFLIEMLKIVINEPVRFRIDRHVDLRVVQDGNARQHDRRTVRLHRRTIVEIIHILEEDAHRYLFIGIIACEIDADERNKLYLRMRLQETNDFFLRGICWNHIQQVFHFNHPFPFVGRHFIRCNDSGTKKPHSKAFPYMRGKQSYTATLPTYLSMRLS